MEYVSGNIFLRPNNLVKAGDGVKGDLHNFDHTTFVVHGAVHVKVTDPPGNTIIEGDFVAGEHFLVKAQYLHDIVATVDGTQFVCIYSHRTPQGDIILEYNGWGTNYQ